MKKLKVFKNSLKKASTTTSFYYQDKKKKVHFTI